jgi:hypothetical protein
MVVGFSANCKAHAANKSEKLGIRFTEGGGAFGAGAVSAEIVVAEDAGGMAIVEIDLDGVVAYLRGGLRARRGLVHGQERRGGEVHGSEIFFFGALVVAGGAGAVVAEIREIEVAGVAVGPGDVDPSAGFHVNLDRDGFLALVEWCGHREVISDPPEGFKRESEASKNNSTD